MKHNSSTKVIVSKSEHLRNMACSMYESSVLVADFHVYSGIRVRFNKIRDFDKSGDSELTRTR